VGIDLPELSWVVGNSWKSKVRLSTWNGDVSGYDLASLSMWIRTHPYGVVKVPGFRLNSDLLEPVRFFFAELVGKSANKSSNPADPDSIVCHIRTGDVWSATRARNPDYVQPPLSFYGALRELWSADLTFIGDGLIGSSLAYKLKKGLGKVTMLESSDLLTDFNFLRKTANMCASISTFAWGAAWLRDRAAVTHIPSLGLFNPVQRPDLQPQLMDAFVYQFPILKLAGNKDDFSFFTSAKTSIESTSNPRVFTVRVNS
jgi:hypothetical protein